MTSEPTPLRDALRTVAAASATSYGYTISIWASGALLMSHHGVPRPSGVLGFIAGAICAFSVLALISRDPHAEPIHDEDDRTLAGTLHWLASGAAVTSAALISPLHSWAVWPLTSFAATCSYLLATSAQLAAIAARRHRLSAAPLPRRRWPKPARDPQTPTGA